MTVTAGSGQVSLKWSEVAGAASYNVKRSTTQGGAYATIAENVTGTSYTDTGLMNGTTYYYVVTAVNDGGESANSAEAEATPTEPVTPAGPLKAPEGLTLTASSGQVSLKWSEVAGAASYNVKRSTTQGGAYATIVENVAGTSYTDTGLMNGTTYYYVVTAVNDGGESANSAEAEATPYFIKHRSSSSGGSGGGSAVTTPDVTAEPQTGGVKLEHLPTVGETTADGRQAVKAVLNDEALAEALEALKAAVGSADQRIAIALKGNNEPIGRLEIAPAALAELAAQAPNAVISVQYGAAAYDLPLKAVDLAALASKLGAAFQEVKLIVSIETVGGETLAELEDQAKRAGLKLVAPAVDFTLTAEDHNGKQITVNDFGTIYVSRTLEFAHEVNPQTATAIWYDPASGAFRFVPATFAVSGGVTRATIQRPGNSIYTVVEHAKSFDDLSGHWSRSDVELLASKLVINGMTDSSFAPQRDITRAEFAALLVRALGLTETASAKFSDVRPGDWFAGAVGAASQAGLVDGFENGSFQPEASITREQMAVMIARAMNAAGKRADGSLASLSRFADAQSIGSWAREAVAQAVNAGIINGVTADDFAPSAEASRAEAAVMLKRMLQYERLID
ncbi:S-layer homology domain-containing protein [Paenibacillus doosanensis]|nr:S-layer homology domain-containing protein [Paenibacillus doosanensis]MCS7460853.1 S-layer homology domain-containing protein [Paenibacillus doosanensis]